MIDETSGHEDFDAAMRREAHVGIIILLIIGFLGVLLEAKEKLKE